ncbi:hypothetical protein J437_LFUL002100 [Ladona fulva]|uniref:Uncharacterized protein n=1 Tax=Ladona fulva TaxID=123851 RepID=A0A8K0K0E1_LADFU|nr:hypothetical protein J437_LFUL002100 [Ladona fulva]
MDHEKESYEWREAEEADVDPVLLRERPESAFIHNLIKGSLKWSRACPEMKTTLYVPVERRWQGSVIVNLQVCART